MTASLRVIRFRDSGAREYHELAFCVPSADHSEVVVHYADRVARVSPPMLVLSLDINVKTLQTKAHVLDTVVRDGENLRRALHVRQIDANRVRACTRLAASCGPPHALAPTLALAVRTGLPSA